MLDDKTINPPVTLDKDNIQTFPVSLEKEINGIGMGVLENGIAYLTGNGLAEACGIAQQTFQEIYEKWNKGIDTKVGKYIKKSLKEFKLLSGLAISDLPLKSERYSNL